MSLGGRAMAAEGGTLRVRSYGDMQSIDPAFSKGVIDEEIHASIYNKLVRLRNRYENAFAQIDVQLKRRYDLIPNLVETAKGYMKHEKETLEAVISARNSAVTASSQAAGAPGDRA